MKPHNFLTKSIFKTGMECPRKLFYLNKPEEYLDNKVEDPFLEALARGGYQVGALAQLKYPKGIEVKSKNHAEAIKETNDLLKQNNVTIFEAAFAFENLFIRADIAIKTGNLLRLIEVKSKSFDPTDFVREFLDIRLAKKNILKLKGDWPLYFYDMAFQTYVARRSRADLIVSQSFMGLDQTASCTEDGVHQLFLIKQIGKSKEVILTKKIDANFKGHQILKEIDVTDTINQILEGNETSEFVIMGSMQNRAEKLADLYLKNERFPAEQATSKDCKKCEFRGSVPGLKSGYDECWIEKANIQAASSKQFSFDLWNFQSSHKALQNNKFLMDDLTSEDLGDGKNAKRQIIQLELFKKQRTDPYIDELGLATEMRSWTYPLHFIDFETCMPAIPFLKGFSPYSEIAFQFSHHVMHEDGRVEHSGEFIDLTPGKFPTFEFLRELKKQLEKDKGTIFRYSGHENNVINRAIFMLERSQEEDKESLVKFFKSITAKKASQKEGDYLWIGDRNMVDLLELVKRFYLSSRMGSSNSLKYVLPAILNESRWLQERYSKPIYGSEAIPSTNFKNHQWIKISNGICISDPYGELDPIFSPEDLQVIENIFSDEDETIKNGGVAMMAYCKCQFTEMSTQERNLIQQALLKYCELDTLAMVMLVEYWRDVCGTATNAA